MQSHAESKAKKWKCFFVCLIMCWNTPFRKVSLCDVRKGSFADSSASVVTTLSAASAAWDFFVYGAALLTFVHHQRAQLSTACEPKHRGFLLALPSLLVLNRCWKQRHCVCIKHHFSWRWCVFEPLAAGVQWSSCFSLYKSISGSDWQEARTRRSTCVQPDFETRHQQWDSVQGRTHQVSIACDEFTRCLLNSSAAKD